MRIVHGAKVESKAESQHRGGVSRRQRLFEDEKGRIDNFSLVIARPKGRFSPRHRHNFEQFRYQVEGEADYGDTGVLKPGMLGYFPESVHYGPQTQGEGQNLCVLTLQCGGASGSGYLGRDAEFTLTKELEKIGTFKDGVFIRNPEVPGKKNMDAAQAIWEYAMGRPLVYPKPRYERPILMHPENFEWVPLSEQTGVSEKFMGTFTERRISASFFKLDPEAAFEVSGEREIYVVLKGGGDLHGEDYGVHTAIFLETRGERATFKAREETELLHFRLPNLAGIEAALPRAQAQAAAE
jgi:mannose-6-phosphate isomerase-like protein (cupin superfamily)